MIYVICKNIVTKENLENFINAAKRHAQTSLNIDKGCLRFDITNYNCDTSEILFIELWENNNCLDIHTDRCKTSIDCTNINKYRDKKDITLYTI